MNEKTSTASLYESLKNQAREQSYVEPDDQTYFANSRINDESIRLRNLVERAIVRQVVKDILSHSEAGERTMISVYDGEDYAVRKSSSLEEIMNSIMSTDTDSLGIRIVDAEGKDLPIGCVFLIYGNDGYDVIADNHMSVEPFLKGATALSEEFEILMF